MIGPMSDRPRSRVRGADSGQQPGSVIVELSIHTLAAGGDGVGPDSTGRVTFVPNTAPGDRVRARITESRKSYARAELVEVLEPSAERVEPECPLFVEKRCGGCQWQHLDLAAQHLGKMAICRRELRRHITAGMELRPIVAKVTPYKWRRRARLHWTRPRGAERAFIGFFAPRSHDIVDIDACPQMERALLDALRLVRSELAPHLNGSGEIEILAGHSGQAHISINGFCSPKYASRLVGKSGLLGTIMGVTLHDSQGKYHSAPPPWRQRQKRPRSTKRPLRRAINADAPASAFRKSLQWGKRSIALETRLRGRADMFAQASLAGNQALLDAVDQACGEREGKRVVEFHAGAGNLTRAIARGNPAEIVSTDRQRVPWNKDLRLGPAADIAEDLMEDGYYFDIAVLDPPRTGAADLMEPLAELHPSRIVYVSCDPATLARDIDILVRNGYRAVSAQPVDLMPQTAHVEIVALLEATDPASGYGDSER